jgi:hypothetical protein
MSVLCVILDQKTADAVVGGKDKGYLNNAVLSPVQRLGGTAGDPDPCYILNAAVLSDPDFSSAKVYLSACRQKWTTDPTFPPELPESIE